MNIALHLTQLQDLQISQGFPEFSVNNFFGSILF